MSKRKRPPMQPIIIDDRGAARFQANKVVAYLLKEASAHGVDLNHLARVAGDFPTSDQEQFAQLIEAFAARVRAKR